MLFHPRFLCFSYAGSLVSIIHLVTGYPEVHIPTLMALVAILHLAESALIFVDGYNGSSPVFFAQEWEGGGRICYAQIVAYAHHCAGGVGCASSGVEWQSVAMPDWWPIFHGGLEVPEGRCWSTCSSQWLSLWLQRFVQTITQSKSRRSAGCC